MASMAPLIVTINVRWWVPYYILTLALFCRTFGTQPDADRVVDFIVKRGVRISAP